MSNSSIVGFNSTAASPLVSKAEQASKEPDLILQKLPFDMVCNIINFLHRGARVPLMNSCHTFNRIFLRPPFALPSIARVINACSWKFPFPQVTTFCPRSDVRLFALGMNQKTAAAAYNLCTPYDEAAQKLSSVVIPRNILASFDDFSYDAATNRFLAATLQHNEVIIWDAAKNEVVQKSRLNASAKAIHCQGDCLLELNNYGIHIRKMNALDKPVQFCDLEHVKWFRMSRDLKQIYTCSSLAPNSEFFLTIWDVETKKKIETPLGIPSLGIPLGMFLAKFALPTYDFERNWVVGVNSDDEICIWDGTKGNLINTLNKKPVIAANEQGFFDDLPVTTVSVPKTKAFYFESTSGKLIVHKRFPGPGFNENQLIVWDALTGSLSQKINCPKDMTIQYMELDPATNILLTWNETQYHFWDLENAKWIKTFECKDKNPIEKIFWHKNKNVLYILEKTGNLTIYDYSRPPKKSSDEQHVEEDTTPIEMASNPILERLLGFGTHHVISLDHKIREDLATLKKLKKQLSKSPYDAEMNLLLISLTLKMLENKTNEPIKVELLNLRNVLQATPSETNVKELVSIIDAILVKCYEDIDDAAASTPKTNQNVPVPFNFTFNESWGKENPNTIKALKNFLKDIYNSPKVEIFNKALSPMTPASEKGLYLAAAILWQWATKIKEESSFPEIFISSLDHIETFLKLFNGEDDFFKMVNKLFGHSKAQKSEWEKIFYEICQSATFLNNNASTAATAAASAAKAMSPDCDEKLIASLVNAIDAYLNAVARAKEQLLAEEAARRSVNQLTRSRVEPTRAALTYQGHAAASLHDENSNLELARWHARIGNFDQAKIYAEDIADRVLRNAALKTINEEIAKKYRFPTNKSVTSKSMDEMYSHVKEALVKDKDFAEKHTLLHTMINPALDVETVTLIIDTIPHGDLRDCAYVDVIMALKRAGRTNEARQLAKRISNQGIVPALIK